MRDKVLVTMLAVGLGALALAQPTPMGPGQVQPVPPEQLVSALDQEMEWLTELQIDAPGWEDALSALQEAFDELQKSEGTPSLETLARLDSALDLVIGILERSAFQRVRAQAEEARQGPPEWLEEYLDEATAGMGPEDAARVRAIVQGLVGGMRAQVKQAARERLGGDRIRREPGRTGRVQEGMPPEFRAWLEGYLSGATAGMSEEEAGQVREICRGAIRTGWEFQQERKGSLQENQRHFLHLLGISRGLDITILRSTAG